MTNQEIYELCDQYGIVNYVINNEGSIDVFDTVDLSGLALTELPFDFNVVHGIFYYYGNRLTTLKGAPKEVTGDFVCDTNTLTSLKYSPKVIGGVFACSLNYLTSLEDGPEYVGNDYICDADGSKLTFDGITNNIKGIVQGLYNNEVSVINLFNNGILPEQISNDANLDLIKMYRKWTINNIITK